jgi:hypothetical protein
VRGRRIEIAAEIADLKVEHAERLRAVDHAEDVALARELAELLDRQDGAVRVLDVRERDHPRAIRDGAREQAQCLLRCGHGRGKLDLLDQDTSPAGEHEPRTQRCRMLACSRNDLVALGEVETRGDRRQ